MNHKAHRNRQFLDWAAGTCLGALVGLMAGLSVSPVAQAVLSAICASIGGWLVSAPGPRPSPKEATAGPETNADSLDRSAMNLRLIGFSTAAIVGIIIGISARTHNWLGASVPERLKPWRDAGFSETEARKAILLEVTDANSASKHASGVLFSASRKVPKLNPRDYGNDVVKILQAYRNQGEPWASLADTVSRESLQEQRELLQAIWNVLECVE